MYRKFHEDMQELVQSDYRGDGGEGWERIFLDLSYIKEINYPKERDTGEGREGRRARLCVQNFLLSPVPA